MKTLVVTSLYIDTITSKFSEINSHDGQHALAVNDANIYLADFVESLRTRGEYEGDILLMFYGGPMSRPMRESLAENNVKTIYIENSLQNWIPVCYMRYLDFLKLNVSSYDNIAFFDNDIWFQDSIAPMWESLPEKGCLMGGHIRKNDMILLHPSETELIAKFQDNMKSIQKRYGYYGVNGGLLAGSNGNIHERLLKIQNLYTEGYVPKIWGSDQFAINLLFDIERDRHDWKMNYSFINPFFNSRQFNYDGKYWVSENGERPVAIHLVADLRGDPRLRFSRVSSSR